MVPHGIFNQSRRFVCGKAVFCLSNELRFANKAADQCTSTSDQIFTCDVLGLAIVDPFAIGTNAFQNSSPKTAFVRAAFGCGNGVTVRLNKPIPRRGPIDGPFHLAGCLKALLKINDACKWIFGIGRRAIQCFAQIIGQPTREMKGGLGWCRAIINFRFPTDFDAAEQIRFGANRFE